MRKQTAVLEDVADATAVLGHEQAALRVDQRLAVDHDAAAVGPDQAADDIDQRGLARARAAEQRRHAGLRDEACGQAKRVARMIDVDVEAHVATRGAPMRRASSSDASRAAIEITTETSVSRSAPASPPGTWVRV